MQADEWGAEQTSGSDAERESSKDIGGGSHSNIEGWKAAITLGAVMRSQQHLACISPSFRPTHQHHPAGVWSHLLSAHDGPAPK